MTSVWSRILWLVAFTLVPAVIGFGSEPAKQSDKPKFQSKSTFKPSTAWPRFGNVFYRDKTGTYYLDPVCRKVGFIADTTVKAEFAGKTYCFDSEACSKIFAKESTTYLAGMRIPAGVVSIAGQVVTVADPVNSVGIELKQETPYFDYASKRYYFSADSTLKQFASNPDKYRINAKSGSAK